MTKSLSRNKKERWWAWHQENPHVYRLFKRFTFEALMKQRHKHLGAWLVVNRIRWETNIETTGEDFKISNDFIAYYARLFMAQHPEHKGLFRTKRLKGERHLPIRQSMFEENQNGRSQRETTEDGGRSFDVQCSTSGDDDI